MTIVTKVGVPYDDHMNDDAPEVDSFFSQMLPGSLLPPFLRREPGDKARASGPSRPQNRARDNSPANLLPVFVNLSSYSLSPTQPLPPNHSLHLVRKIRVLITSRCDMPDGRRPHAGFRIGSAAR